MQISAFRLAQQNYARRRRIAYGFVQDEAVRSGFVRADLRLAETNESTLDAWRATWSGPHPTGDGSWDWERLLRRAWRRPSAFHLAIWSGERLCGLAVGRASKRRPAGVRHTVSVHFIESAHHRDHPLRHTIAPLVIGAAEAYGKLLGASRIRLVDPLPGVVPLYEAFGFALAEQAEQSVYWERRIQP